MHRLRTLVVASTLGLMALASVGWASSPAAGVPPGFRAQSLSWISPTRGWMLGIAPCGQATCTTVVATTDGGNTWDRVGKMKAPLGIEDQAGVSEVRFADDQDGWAFEPALWATTDGGATWQHQVPPGGGHVVLALAGDAEGVYALVSPCRLNHLCHQPIGLWRTEPGQGSWTKVSLSLPVFSGLGEAVLAVHGAVAYLGVPAALIGPAGEDVFEVTLDGQTWAPRPDPCDVGNGETLSGIAPISDSTVALMCQANIGFGKARKRVVRSNDTGQTTSPAGVLPELGIVSQLAAAPNGTLAVASSSIGSWIYRNGGKRAWTTSVDLGDGGMGWNDVSFTTNEVGFVIHGPAAAPWLPGELWTTVDGGLTWGPVA